MKKLVAMLGSVILGLGGVGNSVYARTVEQFSEENGWKPFSNKKMTRQESRLNVMRLKRHFLERVNVDEDCGAFCMMYQALSRALSKDCYVVPIASESKKFFGFGESTYSLFVNEENIETIEKYLPKFISALQNYMNLDNSKKNYSVEAKKCVDIMNNCLKKFPINTRNVFTDELGVAGVNLSL